MNYDDTFRFLELPQKPNTYLFERLPPVFICNEKETQKSLKRIFNFSDTLFKNHQIIGKFIPFVYYFVFFHLF